MDPLQRAASSTSSKKKSADIEQFGRSETSLHAEHAAASIRADKTGGVKDPTASEHESSQTADSLSSASDRAVSQPLTSNPSVKSTTSSTDSDSKSKQPSAITTENISQTALNRPSTGGQRIYQSRPATRPGGLRRPQHQSTPDLAGLSGRTPGSPVTYQDLGTDYTRYYNPFSDSRRSSTYSEHRSGTARGGAHTTGTTTPLAALFGGSPLHSPNASTPNVSTTKLHTLYDPEKNASVVDDRLSAPYEEKGMAAWPLIGDKEEDDDEMHMPHPDDDIKYKPKLSDHFGRDSIASTIGLAIMALGLLFIFVALPVMSSLGVIDYNSSFSVPLSWLQNSRYKPEPWAIVNNKVYPYLKNIRTGLIDRDTPKSAMTRKGEFGDEYELVFSDEFNDNNRTFYEGDDPYFFAGNFWYGATKDLEWYDPDAVTTYDGTLELRLDKFPNHGLEFRSGMLNSWNQLCFKGGIFEVSVSLPGPAGHPGLWPGAWTMGNLGRPGYLATTDGMWPYTYQACDVGITPNQSSSDGLSNLPGQRLPSCTCPGEDHPTPGKGRGAPEIDIIEVGATYPPALMPIATQSYQVAPFDVHWYPNYNFTAFPDYSLSWYNGYTGGPYQQAISATTNLNKDWYDGKAYQRYNFEYVPGEGKDAFINWKIGDQTMFMMDGRAIGPNGNIKARQVSEEPMSLILNLGISNSWTWIDWDNMKFPAVMRVDYVRWYQKKGQEMVTCDPPGFETTKYIKDHIVAYTNPNLTHWDETGFSWPKHKLNSECKAKS